jgi:hypothetical protein
MRLVGKDTCWTWWLASAPLLMACCYRTPMLPPPCDLEVKPAALDFGQVLPGDSQTLAVSMVNHGEGECLLRNLALDAKNDPGFSLAGPLPTMVSSGVPATVAVTFAPANASIPLNRKGTLAFDVESVSARHVAVSLAATVISDCRLKVEPNALDFGHVAIGTAPTRSVLVRNDGKTPCEIGSIGLRPGSDSQFRLEPGSALVSLSPGEQAPITVRFDAHDVAVPHHRTGTLAFLTNQTGQTDVAIPLSADIDIGCDLAWSPASIDFGTVTLNKTSTAEVALTNPGSATCQISDITLTPDTASSFRLTSASSVAVPAGGTASIGVSFFADSSLPHAKTGTLIFQTGNPRNPTAKVPLSGHVNTPCEAASQWIYTFDENNGFARFDPTTLTFTEIANLKCAANGTPFSMAVDQNAVAWVHYSDGSLFKVDTATGKCEATKFEPNQHGIRVFGMGFVFDPSTSKDTLFIAGGASSTPVGAQLATVSFPDLVVNPIGTIDEGNPELTGTGDGQLWGFTPQNVSGTTKATLVRLDPKSAATIESYGYPSVTTSGGWSVKFWGGYFWIFLGTSVYKVSRDNPKVIETAIQQTGRPQIVGAGVSTCAPL